MGMAGAFQLYPVVQTQARPGFRADTDDGKQTTFENITVVGIDDTHAKDVALRRVAARAVKFQAQTRHILS